MPNEKLKQRGRETRHRILDAAFTVFAQRGFQAASVDEIVNIAGKSKGAFYYHFASKESVFLELISTHVFPHLADTNTSIGVAHSTTLVALLMEFWVTSIRQSRVKESLSALYQSRMRVMLPDLEASAIPRDSMDDFCRTVIAIEDGLLIQEALGFPKHSLDLHGFVRKHLEAYFAGNEIRHH